MAPEKQGSYGLSLNGLKSSFFSTWLLVFWPAAYHIKYSQKYQATQYLFTPTQELFQRLETLVKEGQRETHDKEQVSKT